MRVISQAMVIFPIRTGCVVYTRHNLIGDDVAICPTEYSNLMNMQNLGSRIIIFENPYTFFEKF